MRPGWLAVIGVTAYGVAFSHPRAGSAGSGPSWAQPGRGLPNPSGLNAHWSLDALVAEFDRLR